MDIINKTNAQIQISVPMHHEEAATTVRHPTNWSQFITKQSKWDRNFLSKLQWKQTPKALWQQLLNPYQVIYIASDGGYDQIKGSYGWVIGDDAEIYVIGNGIATGNPTTSYRAEGFGILSSLRFLTKYIEYYGIIETTQIRLYCDNKSMINQITNYDENKKMAN